MNEELAQNVPEILTSNDNRTIKVLTGVGSLENCDDLILSNSLIQIAAMTVMITIYFVCRNKTPWVYYPNIKNKPQHPCYRQDPGIFSWICPLITTKDTEALSVIGFDGFMFLQLLKMLYRICICLSIIVIPLLCYSFFNFTKESEYFLKFTISGITHPHIYWLIAGMAYIITIIVLYIVFIYYKRYVTLRQMYLAAPATMTSVTQLKNLAKCLGGDQNAIDYVNISARTVIIDRLASTIKNDKELYKYIVSLKIGEIDSVSLVHSTYGLQKLYEERSEAIQDIEKVIAKAIIESKSFYKNNRDMCKESFGDAYNNELDESVETLLEGKAMTIDEKVDIFNNFNKYGEKFFAKSLLGRSMVTLGIERLKEVNDRIMEERRRLQDNPQPDDTETPIASDMLYVNSDLENDVSFFSWKQIGHMIKNWDLFSLDLPIAKRRAFITFKDQRTAGIVRQTRLGTRVFSSNISPAPAPHDVFWRNIYRDEVSGYFLKIISLGLYVIFNFTFLIFVVLIVKSLEIEPDTENFIFKFILKTPYLHSLYKGILAPLIYNIFLFFVPIIIKALLHMEHNASFSQLQVKLMYRLSLFLFFNAFLATIVLSAALSVFDKIRKGTLTIDTPIIVELGKSIMRTSVFFFNTVVQRLCVGSALVLLKPSPFLYNWFIAPLVIYTRRQERELEFSPPIDFGNHIPNVLLIFPMALVYSCICPFMLLISWAFYVFSYIIYRNELLYASRNDYESGGLHWKSCVRFILYALLTFQITMAVFIFSADIQSVFYLFIPLIFLTYITMEGMNMAFESSCENFPMNAPEEKFLDNFSRKTLEERHQLLSEWKEIGEEEDEDVLPITEIGFDSEKVELGNSYYRDPAFVETSAEIILPHNFYKTVYFMMHWDKNNVMGLKK